MASLSSFFYERVLKQYSIGPWLGALKDLLSRTMFYMTPLNLFMLAATTYRVTAHDYIAQFAPWINFWLFFGGLVFVGVCAMVIEYKVIFPSSVTFSNPMGYKPGNLLRRDLDVIMEEIRRLEAKLDALNGQAGNAGGR